jgi:alkylated DNA repair dioxygenase AlkB
MRSVELPQGHLAFAEGLPPVPLQLMGTLLEQVPWEQPTYNFGGVTVPQPRLSCWMGDPEAVYRYSGRTYAPQPWHPAVEQLRQVMSGVADDLLPGGFNGCLLNYYRDNHDSISFHSDDEPELGRQPVVVTLSLGAQRVMQLRHKYREHPAVRLPLPDNSVLLMWGRTQQLWKHGIPKQKRLCGQRLSLTFRRIYTKEELRVGA